MGTIDSYIVSWLLNDLDHNGVVDQLASPPRLRDNLPTVLAFMRARGILASDDTLYLARVKGSEYAVFRLRFDPLSHDLGAEHLFSYEQRGWAIDPTRVRVPDALQAAQAALSVVPINASHVSAALVRRILRAGGVRVRRLGGAYFIPAYARPFIDPLLEGIETAGGDVRRIPLERGTGLIRKVASDAVKAFKTALDDLHAALKKANTEARARKLLAEIEDVRSHIRWYKGLLNEFEEEVEKVERGTTFERLTEVTV